jgi:hypothetical protein
MLACWQASSSERAPCAASLSRSLLGLGGCLIEPQAFWVWGSA